MIRVMAYLIIVLGVSGATSALSSEYSQLPSSIVGSYLTYSSGTVTSFDHRQVLFLSQINEYYVYSRSGRSGVISKVKYNGSGKLVMEDKVVGEMYQQLIGKDKVYKRCGAIYSPGVEFLIEPIRSAETQTYFSNQWAVKQKTAHCELFTVRHHSDGDRCESICNRWAKRLNPNYNDMRLYINKSDAMEDSSKRK